MQGGGRNFRTSISEVQASRGSFIQQGHNTAAASVDLAFTNISFSPIRSGLNAGAALLVNPANSFTVFNLFSLPVLRNANSSLAPVLLTCFFCFPTLADAKEEAGSPVDSKQEVFGVR